ncbi:MAG: DUF192 domain-containing protein [Alphaproteobacteria bacterium]|nr:DUF192 domain-containing protein [Alphaproteobacteria bacterium]
MSKLIYVLGLAFLLISCSKKDLKPLTIQTSNGTVTYYVEIAATKEEMIKGLMYRKHLDKNSGMLFLFDNSHPQPVAMWMKNTFISLDMLFINSSGQIIGIAQNTEPLSLKIISPTKQKVAAVVELNAGEVQKHTIKIGDKVIYRP